MSFAESVIVIASRASVQKLFRVLSTTRRERRRKNESLFQFFSPPLQSFLQKQFTKQCRMMLTRRFLLNMSTTNLLHCLVETIRDILKKVSPTLSVHLLSIGIMETTISTPIFLKKEHFSFFRVDRMESIKLVPNKREGKDLFNEKTLRSKQKAKVFDMYSTGNEERVTLRGINVIADQVVDAFGKDITLMADLKDLKYSTTNVLVDVCPAFFS